MVFNIHHIHIWFCGQTKNMWFLSLSAIPIDYAVRLRIRGFKSFHDTNHLRGQTKNMWLLNLITIFISTRKCCFYAVFRYLSSDLLHFYSNFKPIFSVQLLLLFSFLLKRACINRLSLPMWNDLRVSALPVGLLHFHNTL